ncbi:MULTISPECIES: YeiH family putative sulfate export transporter [Ramlibacter]|uniref:YeiH family putative sulfate export transporter n=1 Tax=Ramlibacter aquaticus TaxID=2780094 RepID=A0ABR9SD40_9BURK|nr:MULTISPECIES: YeiH family putative sulfate export transporter [Ramlibacter]MBE7940268.1 YeiH family putative sulfate export transporter [Ramlibacter aquaticus]
MSTALPSPVPFPPLTALRRLAPGLLACALLAVAGSQLASVDLLARHGLSALTLALMLGMLAGNLLPAPVLAHCGPGIGLAKQRILRLGVVLYGLRLTVQDIGHVGWAGVLVDAAMVCSTFALACGLGIRWLGLDRKTAMLIGIGSSICGAAAVVAAEPVVKARAEQVTVAVATVVVFGTLATFLYPLLFAAAAHGWPLPAQGRSFGLYVGSTVHEVAQVIAAARAVSPEAADTAVIAKMVRVMMLAPFLLALSALGPRGGGAARTRTSVPWFAFAFIGVVLLNSLHGLPAPWAARLVELDTGLLAMAMAALGLATQVRMMREAGSRPLLLAALLFAWLVVGGAALNAWLPALLA